MRKLIFACLLAGGVMAGFAGIARAQSPEEQIVAGLAEQGYAVVMRDRTWLGRIWLVVENGEIRREIVFNPGTGEILRDYAVMLALAEGDRSGRSSTRAPVLGSAVTNDTAVIQGDATGAAADPAPPVSEPLLVLPSLGE